MMLEYAIESATNDIRKLIEITEKEIDFLEQANRDELFSKIEFKNEIFNSFVNKKAMLDNELVKLLNSSKEGTLETLLNSEEKTLLEDLKENLIALKEKNREFAKLLIAVGDFYNSLLNKLLPKEHNNYGGSQHKPASILNLDV
jgi:hypothetical protein